MALSRKEEITAQGAYLIKAEFDVQCTEAIDLTSQFEIQKNELISSRLIVNKNVGEKIRERIKSHGENIKKIVAATAYFIEEEKLQSIDEAVGRFGSKDRMELKKFSDLVDTQKKMTISYSTLHAVVEIFKGANKLMLSEIKGLEQEKEVEGRIARTNLLLKNALMAYELTNFVIDQLDNFQLNGLQELKTIEKEIKNELDFEDKKDNEFLQKAKKAGSQMYAKEVEGRRDFRNKVRQKWKQIMERVDAQSSKIEEVSSFKNQLELFKENAERQIATLKIAGTTILIENSISAINDLASGINGLELPALDEKMACELLNIELDL